MFITAVCVKFLIKLRWPKTKSLYLEKTLQYFSVPRWCLQTMKMLQISKTGTLTSASVTVSQSILKNIIQSETR